MRVRAIAPGFYDINKNAHPIDIKVGQEFEVANDLKAKWFVPVEPEKPADTTGKPPAKPAPNK